jgi:small subunit ribosomal protein S1
VIDAKIKSFTKDGAVVDLGPGIDAIIRTRDLSWSPIEHPYEAVKRGETVQAKILQVDKGRRRVQLGIRQLTLDPFLEKFEKYKVDQTLQGEVLWTNDFGAELQLESELTAFLPVSEIAWNRVESVAHVLKPGDIVEAKIITLDPERRKITVSRKQMIENPMKKIESTYRVGTDHNGTIKEVNKGGVVVALEHNAEGFVPRRELSHDRIERLEDVFKAGKPLENLRVIEYDRRNGRITLSAIEAEREAQKKTLKNYKATSKASSFTIGDLASLKEKLEKIERGG